MFVVKERPHTMFVVNSEELGKVKDVLVGVNLEPEWPIIGAKTWLVVPEARVN